MDRSFMIRSGRTGMCYCGKCGRKQLGDRYNMRKHAAECGFCIEEEVLTLEEGTDLGYRLEDREDSLILSVCRPVLRPIRGFTDRFSGMEWIGVFEAEFPAGSKCPSVNRNETGMDMDVILTLIRAGRIVRIPMESDAGVIRKVFSSVIDVYSLQMFAHIYRNKGYNADRALCREAERALFKKVPDESEWNKICSTANTDEETGMTPLHDHTEERLPLIVSLYRYRNDRYILQVITQTEGEKTVFLFARGYCACSREVSLREVLDRQYYLAGSYKSAIDRFDRACPEFHLKQYAERSPNILVPLLAADYHAGMELAARSGVPGIAENYDQLSAMDINPALYRSLKDMFGLPMSVLRALSRSQSCDLIIDRLRAVYAHNPVLVQFDSFTESMIRFYLRADIVPDGRRDAAGRRDRIRGIRQLSDRQILQILRYLKERPNIGQYYFDYLTACDQLGEYPFGITPRIPIQEAHNLTVARIMYSRDKTTESAFETEVSAKKYMDLATDQREEDEEKFKDDKYLVTVPRSGDDLFAESENMHNCVRIYVPRVAQGETRIYFLRQKKDPGKSYGTLEVSGDGEQLWQAKAFGNAPLEEDAQRFVVKWCRSKGIGISTWDIDRKFMRRT